MVKLTGDDGEVRRQSLRGHFYVCVRRGQIIMAAWPTKRKRPMSEKQVAAVEKFRQAATATKYMEAGDQATAYELTKRTNALPRDLLMMALYGRLGTLFLSGGKRIYSLATLKDATSLLDAITYDKGSMLFRNDEFWWRLPPGAPGQFLRVNADGVPEWNDGGSGGGGFSDPSKSTLLTLETDQALVPNQWNRLTHWQETRDYLGAWDEALPGRLVIPYGITFARLQTKLEWTQNNTSKRYVQILHWNAADELQDVSAADFRYGADNACSTPISPWIGVAPGDYFELWVHPSSLSLSILAAGTYAPSWLQMEMA